jgi:hypothetical protein
MITFSPLRRRRLDVRLQELSIGDEIELCGLPELAHEKALTEFLARAVASAETPSPAHVADPRAWSVGERLMALAHYCIHVREDGPDYSVTETSKLSDYLDAGKDLPETPATFEAHGDKWVLRPLTGAAAEVLETLQIESTLPGRAYWLLGAMAAQLVREGESTPDPLSEEAKYAEWLKARMETMRSFPSSALDSMYLNYRAALDRDGQFFTIWFDEQGVVVLPKEAGAVAPPARFHVHAAIGAIALSVTGKA